MIKILVVDDEAGIRALLSEILMDEGYLIYEAENASEARVMVSQEQFTLVLLDIWMPDTDGVSLLKEWSLNGVLRKTCVIMMSGHGSIDTAAEAVRLGAMAYLEKPIAMKALIRTVRNTIQQWTSLLEAQQLCHQEQNHLENTNTPVQTCSNVVSPVPKEIKTTKTYSQLLPERKNIQNNIAFSNEDYEFLLKRVVARFRALFASPLKKETAELSINDLLNYLRVKNRQRASARATEHIRALLAEIACRAPDAPSIDWLLNGRRDSYQESLILSLLEILMAAHNKEHSDSSDILTEDLIYHAKQKGLTNFLEKANFLAYDINRILHALAASASPETHEEDESLLLSLPEPQATSDAIHDATQSLRDTLQNPRENTIFDTNEEPQGLTFIPTPLRFPNVTSKNITADIRTAIAMNSIPVFPLVYVRAYNLITDFNLPLREARDCFERGYLSSQLIANHYSVSMVAKNIGMERTHLYRKLKALDIETSAVTNFVHAPEETRKVRKVKCKNKL